MAGRKNKVNQPQEATETLEPEAPKAEVPKPSESLLTRESRESPESREAFIKRRSSELATRAQLFMKTHPEIAAEIWSATVVVLMKRLIELEWALIERGVSL